MKFFLIVIITLFSVTAKSEVFECKEHDAWPDDKKFSAEIEVMGKDKNIRAKVKSLSLSEPWPLVSACDQPKLGSDLIGYEEAGEIKLSLASGKECGFMLFLSKSVEKPSMLSPRKNYKVFGHSPYLAACHAL